MSDPITSPDQLPLVCFKNHLAAASNRSERTMSACAAPNNSLNRSRSLGALLVTRRRTRLAEWHKSAEARLTGERPDRGGNAGEPVAHGARHAMDQNIVHLLINAYAEDAAAMALRIEDLEADNRVLRELLSAALDQLHSMTKALDHARARRYRLTERVRTQRQHEQRAA